MSRAVDTSHLQRIYFDASHWNRLRAHADREQIIQTFDRSKRAVFPSVISAAELLNTPDSEARSDLCRLMSALLDPEHTVLDHPSQVLKYAVAGRRKGESHFTLTESDAAAALRAWVKRPELLNEEKQHNLKEWIAAMKKDGAEFRNDLAEILGEEGFAGDAGTLINRDDFSRLLRARVPEVAAVTESAEEVRELIARSSTWAWYASSIAYEFHLTRLDMSKRTRKKLPGGPDTRQLMYLGLVNRFVARDEGLLKAARWIAEKLPPTMRPTMLSSGDYFARIGYPFRPAE